MGRVRNMSVQPCKNQKATFTKLASNAIGDPYVDPGKFNGQLRSSSSVSKPFVNMHGNRTVRNSEFANMSEQRKRQPSDTRPSFVNRKTSEPFTSANGIGYALDPYERKQDLARDEYARLNSKIMYPN